MKTYEELERKVKRLRWLSIIMVAIAILSYGSSVSTNQQARKLVEQNKELQRNLDTTEASLANASYELKSNQSDCVKQIEEMLYKFDRGEG